MQERARPNEGSPAGSGAASMPPARPNPLDNPRYSASRREMPWRRSVGAVRIVNMRLPAPGSGPAPEYDTEGCRALQFYAVARLSHAEGAAADVGSHSRNKLPR